VDRCFDLATVDWYQVQFARRSPEHGQHADPIGFLLNWNFVVERTGEMLLTRAGVLLYGADRYVRQILPRPVFDYQRIDVPFDQWSVEQRWHDRYVFEENIFKTWQGLVARYMRIAEHPFSLDRAIFRNWHDLGRVPTQLRNNKARKEFELKLLNSPLITEAIQRFHQTIEVNLARDQAEVLALALGQQDGDRVSLTDIRGLGMSTTLQAKRVAEGLIRQQLLEPVSETLFEVPEALRRRFTQVSKQVTPHVAPQVTPQVLALLEKVSGDMPRGMSGLQIPSGLKSCGVEV